MNLDVVYDVWQDLDGFYESKGFPSWEEMMHQVCLVKDGKPRLSALLSALRAEGYSAPQSLDQLQELSNIFQFVTDNFQSLLVRENWSQELYEGSKNYFEVVDSMTLFTPLLLERNKVMEGRKEYIVGLDEYFANPYALDYLSAEGGEARYHELFVDNSFFEYTYSALDKKMHRKEGVQEPVFLNSMSDSELAALRAGYERKDEVSLFVAKCLLRGEFAEKAAKFSRVIVFKAEQLVQEGTNRFGREELEFKAKKTFGYKYLRGVKKDAIGNTALLLGVI